MIDNTAVAVEESNSDLDVQALFGSELSSTKLQEYVARAEVREEQEVGTASAVSLVTFSIVLEC